MSRTVLGVFPHPDDESYAAGGTFALASASGARVCIVSVTRGERGEVHGYAGDPRPLAAIRSAELAAACRVLGAEPPRFLDQDDGAIGSADFPAVVARLVRVIRELRPQVVVSLGADGVYGHPDHIATHRLVVASIRAAAGGGRFSEDLGAVHGVDRLLFCAFPQGLFRPQYELMLDTDLAAAVRLVDPRRLGMPLVEADVAVNTSAVAERKLAALACHQSQLANGDPRDLFPTGIIDSLLMAEYFSLASGPAGQKPLDDIFEGLPA